MNSKANRCNRQRIDEFLRSDQIQIADAELVSHLDSCRDCREYLEKQAADAESWNRAADLLQETEFDVASSIHRWERTNPETKFRHWLRRVARNTILSALTRQPKDAAVGGSEMLDLLAGHPKNEQLVEQELATETIRELYLHAA
ncbi:MAG: hypothetical protein CBB60_007410, partial [Armatimonadetes bacterium Cent15-Ar3]